MSALRQLNLLSVALLGVLACSSSDSTAPEPFSLSGYIVFTAGTRINALDIYAILPNGAGLRNLTKHPAYYGRPAPSPDGTTLVFFRAQEPGDSGDLYAQSADGSNLRQLTSSVGSEHGATWRPDGGQIVFVGQQDLYTITPDGGNPTRLTFDSLVFKADPAWAPSGLAIAYSKYDSAVGHYVLHRMAANGTQDTTLLALPGDITSPTWSSDGSFITIEQSEVGPRHLYRLRPQDGEVTQLTTGHVGDRWPSASPTGDTIAFTRTPFDSVVPVITQELYLLVGSTGAIVPVSTFGSTTFAALPAWVGQP